MRRLRWMLLVLVLLAAAVTAGLAYLNRSILPVKARVWIEQSASEALGRPVTVGRVQIHWWHGFVLEKVAVAEEPSFGTGSMLEVEQITGGVLFLPILKNREFIIPALHIVRPRLRLLQNAAGTWNTEGFRFKSSGPAVPPRFRVLIPRVVLIDGDLRVVPSRIPALPPLHLQKIQVEARLSLPAKAEGLVSMELEAAPPVPIKLEGTYNLPERRFQLKSDSEWPLPVVLSYLPKTARAGVGSLEGTAAIDAEISGTAGGPMEIGVWLETGNLKWKKEISAEGTVRARVNGKIASARRPDFWKQLKGTVTLERIQADFVPQIGKIRELSGEILLDAQGARTERLTATISDGIPVEFSGSIANNAERSIGFRVSSQFPLDNPPLVPDPARNFLKNVKLAGQGKLDFQAAGKLLPELSLRPSAALTFQEASAEFPKGQAWSKGQGVIRWQPDLLTFTPIRAEFLDRPLELEGTLVNFSQPEIDMHGTWGDLTAETQLNLTSEKIEIENLSGRYGPARFRVLGEISRPEPVANLLGESSFRIEKLEPLAPKPLAWISKNGLAGDCQARLLVQGNLAKPAALDARLNLSSPELTAWKIPLQSFSAEVTQTDGVLDLKSLQAGVAGGTMRAVGSLRREEPQTPWEARVNADQVDLSSLGRILEWKNQTLSGRLVGQWSGTGEGGNLASVNGAGALQVAGAQILEFPLLGGFAELIGAPALRAIAFQEAQGSFHLEEGKIQTADLRLTSPQATIAVVGWGGFLKGVESPIDWRIVPTFAPKLLPEETRSKIGKVIAKGTSYLMSEVRITGTWKEPKKKLISKPVTQILNEQLFNVQDLLEDIF